MGSTARLVIVAITFTFVGAALVGMGTQPWAPAEADRAPQVREFWLDIRAADIDLGGYQWRAWTYNGTVPGPTLEATVGDRIVVHVKNSMNLTHSLHTHLSPYALESDGSQLNTITGIGGMAMIPPGGEYTYEFVATVPGLLYYHCHSADGGHTISEHMAQGLYGAILIHAAEEPEVDDQVVFMSERGFDADAGAPFYLMNGMGLPGGEHKLEEVFASHGVPGVVAQLGKTVPVLNARVGQSMRINVVNIGDAMHSFHLHGMTAYRDDGSPLPAQVLGLVPGEADRITITPTQPGLWLFHCHVVSHADQGMIGVVIVQPEEGQLDLPPPADLDASAAHDAGGHDAGDAPVVTASKGPEGELSFEPATLTIAQGTPTLKFVNGGRMPHTFTIRELGIDTKDVPRDGVVSIDVSRVKAGTYAFVCAVPGHEAGGMKGTLVVA